MLDLSSQDGFVYTERSVLGIGCGNIIGNADQVYGSNATVSAKVENTVDTIFSWRRESDKS